MMVKYLRSAQYLILALIVVRSPLVIAQENPARKLAAFIGKWQSEGAFANGTQVASSLDCRWSAQEDFLICEQTIKMPAGDHHQLTVYSYRSKDQNYSYTTLADPGAMPSSGSLQINGNVWTYSAKVDRDGKTIQIRTTNEFTTSKSESFKVESSDDGGATWITQLRGAAHRTGD